MIGLLGTALSGPGCNLGWRRLANPLSEDLKTSCITSDDWTWVSGSKSDIFISVLDD